MISERELLKAIQECESLPNSSTNCEKLANLYIIYNQLYGYTDQPLTEKRIEYCVELDSNTDFAKVVNGKRANDAWAVIDELVEALKVIQPRMYDGIIRKISEI